MKIPKGFKIRIAPEDDYAHPIKICTDRLMVKPFIQGSREV
jgi:hypothetical protein